jgi:acetyl-CoA decarbonylase/synthase complex subunit beta
LIDESKGEYEGCNKAYSEMTGGKLNRVFLDSLRDFPQTSCGCFQNLAFWIEEVGGIGIMSRHSEAVAPDGRTWEMLANLAGGKQSPGIFGVSTDYIKSDDFLRGDGGIAKVVWVDSKLHANISRLFKKEQRVATEKHAGSINELKKFLAT